MEKCLLYPPVSPLLQQPESDTESRSMYEGVGYPVTDIYINNITYIIEAYVYQESGVTEDIYLTLEKIDGETSYFRLRL